MGFSERDAQEIKSHPHFSNIDWNLLANKGIKPTFMPNLKNNMDLKYFDKVKNKNNNFSVRIKGQKK